MTLTAQNIIDGLNLNSSEFGDKPFSPPTTNEHGDISTKKDAGAFKITVDINGSQGTAQITIDDISGLSGMVVNIKGTNDKVGLYGTRWYYNINDKLALSEDRKLTQQSQICAEIKNFTRNVAPFCHFSPDPSP